MQKGQDNNNNYPRPYKRKSLFSFEDLDFSDFLKPYKNFKEEYENLARKKRAKNRQAYKVTFRDHSDLVYFTFAKNKDRAKGEATKYFKENFHPSFMGRGWREEYKQARGVKIPELDKYGEKGRVPIPELMKYLKVSFPCSICGNYAFQYSDYEKGKCFIIEGEGNINEITEGIILCYDCYKKYFKDNS